MLELDKVPCTGPIGPRRDGVDLPFWEGLAAGELRMQRCSTCSHWWWAPSWRCGACGSWDLHWEAVPPRGKVFSWVRTHQPFSAAMKEFTPFVTLLVELPDAGNRRLFGILVGPEDGLEVGAPVTGVIQKPSELTSGMAVLRWTLATA
ncbi:MAG TPA: OB-fold domain-containing protein [Rhizomicrobium sp.]|nr:OB-fold domain-containing protein [Rhizomicrobium sp.]